MIIAYHSPSPTPVRRVSATFIFITIRSASPSHHIRSDHCIMTLTDAKLQRCHQANFTVTVTFYAFYISYHFIIGFTIKRKLSAQISKSHESLAVISMHFLQRCCSIPTFFQYHCGGFVSQLSVVVVFYLNYNFILIEYAEHDGHKK